jgi:hypothetical protein
MPPGLIRTRILSKRAAADPCLIPRGHPGRQTFALLYSNTQVHIMSDFHNKLPLTLYPTLHELITTPSTQEC